MASSGPGVTILLKAAEHDMSSLWRILIQYHFGGLILILPFDLGLSYLLIPVKERGLHGTDQQLHQEQSTRFRHFIENQ